MTDPLFTVLTPVYNTDLDHLSAAIDSVVRQSLPDWELILVDDLSPHREVVPFLEERAAVDPRIRVIARKENGGISAASNSGLAEARGRFLVLLDHDDLLEHGALGDIAAALKADDAIDYLYSDEDKVDDLRYRYEAFRKPDWSPERLRGQMYTGHVSVLRTSLVREVGGFDSTYDGSQDHDLVLKVTERARRIHHIPKVLYHWRAAAGSTALSSEVKPYTWDAGVAAVNAHLTRVGIEATATRGPWANVYAIDRPMPTSLTVSIIIPTRGTRGTVFGDERVFVLEAVRSVLESSGHIALEIVVVYDLSTPPGVLDRLRDIADDRLVLVPYGAEFNFSEKCNLGFLASSGERVVFLNDDVEVASQNFVSELVAPLEQADVGMTGAYLFYEDTSVQHAGHQYARRGYRHPMTDFKRGDPGPFCALMVDREVSGLTAACVALRRQVFTEVGGMSELLPANFNDVDLSLKLRRSGYRLLWLNRVQLFHFESQTREPTVEQTEVDFVRARWGNIETDPYLPGSAATYLRIHQKQLDVG